MLSSKKYRRFMLFSVIALGPICSACEIAFDFDRTPLQPIFEGGPPPDAAADAPSDGGREAG